jgi:hypothetical protein
LEGLILGVLGIAITVVLWLLDRRRLKRANARALVPTIVFGNLELYGPDRPVRPDFAYAISFSFTNLGGPAISPITWFEPVSRAALVTGQAMSDFSGIGGSKLSIDPEADARSFVRRAEWYVLYWDLNGTPYVFAPTGPMPIPKEARAFTPKHLQNYLLTHANKTSPPRGSGMGGTGG